MIRYLFNKMLLAFQKRYNYDIRYQQEILNNDVGAFLKFMGFQTLSSHAGNMPAGPLFAARLRAIIREDCGPCTQLVVDMALEAKLSRDNVRAIIESDLHQLPEDMALVVEFTDLVLAHKPEAENLRQKIIAIWGHKGLIAIAYGISSYRVYPALKYTLGYGQACQHINVGDITLAPHQPPNQPTTKSVKQGDELC
ncbi:hypothetical protein [Oceanicoccus sagamiensis]|uniref:Carboxymuconolactone decarboxylase-like domain-containing protein n=1 Tax=Oceanicoccus sagamiensis TaxID=716816 RepID=A0A1X9N826_9GAMM|nr:hypothetical protein [Oceanicoccus sagamiensis]ARN73836.1 hypothetical protein BST96_06735 [Oceanicoccus sagamiensis]